MERSNLSIISIFIKDYKQCELLQSVSLRLELPKLRSFGDGFIRLMSFPLLRVMPFHASMNGSYSLSTGVRTASHSPILLRTTKHGLSFTAGRNLTNQWLCSFPVREACAPPILCSFYTKRITATNGYLFRDSQEGQRPIVFYHTC